MAKSKKKKTHSVKKNPIISKRSNDYIKRRDSKVMAFREAEKDTTMQFMTDTLMLTLNDPEIIGKDVFGEKRLAIIIRGWCKKIDMYYPALEKGDEQDYYQEKMDQALRKIIKDKLIPFAKRYYWLFK